MEFTISPEHQALVELVREFSKRELAGLAAETDRTGLFPQPLRKKLADAGLFGLITPPAEGGSGLGHLALVMAMEEMSRVMPVAANHIQTEAVVQYELLRHGTPEQKKKYLHPTLTADKVGCFAFTEPETGSNPMALRTRVRPVEGGWILNGHKRFITHSPWGDFVITFARDDGDRALSLYIVEFGWKGVSVPRQEDTIGMRGGQLGEVIFDDVFVPAENRLGPPGNMFAELKNAMILGKMCLSSQCLGIMQGGLDEAMNYAQNRIQRGQPILKFPSIRSILAEMASRIEACRWLLYREAWTRDQGLATIKSSAMTKLFVTSTAPEVLRLAIQVHGSYGLTKDFKVERLFRDAKMYELLEGTSEIQRELIAGQLEREYFG